MPSNKHTIFLPAFTLIEILVILAIVGILSTIMLVDFGSSRVTQELEGSAREVAGAFREAQNYALTGYQGVTGSDPCRFDVTWGASAYTTVYWYKDGAGDCTQSSLLRSYTLRNGIVFSGVGTYHFTLPHAAVSFGGASLPVTLTKAGVAYTVCTYANGLINHYAGASCP